MDHLLLMIFAVVFFLAGMAILLFTSQHVNVYTQIMTRNVQRMQKERQAAEQTDHHEPANDQT